jgi:hypothetical protein
MAEVRKCCYSVVMEDLFSILCIAAVIQEHVVTLQVPSSLEPDRNIR